MTDPKIENPAVYDAAYFIAKFEAIPEERWTTSQYIRGESRCAFGHCGLQTEHDSTEDYPEARALTWLAKGKMAVWQVHRVNDGDISVYPQPTPKQRVLAWLRDAQKAGL